MTPLESSIVFVTEMEAPQLFVKNAAKAAYMAEAEAEQEKEAAVYVAKPGFKS